jgi:addiction module HigA family antidote
MRETEFAPIHPGEVLLEEFLKPMDISQYRLAKDISVPPRRINEIVHGQRSIIIAILWFIGTFLAEPSGAL